MNFIAPQFRNDIEAQEFRAFSRQAPTPELVRGDLIEEGYWLRLQSALAKARVRFTGLNLMAAAYTLIEEDRAIAREQARRDRLHAEIIQAWPQDLNESDYANHARVEALCKDSSFTAAKFLDDIAWHPEAWSWKSGPKQLDLVAMVRTANKQRLAEIVSHVGEDRVRAALQELQNRMHKKPQGDAIQGSQAYASVRKVEDQTGGRHHYESVSKEQVAAENAAAQARATAAAEANAQAEAESLAQRAVSSSNHASTQRLREALANTWGSTWVETLQKRQHLYNNWQN